ncbi:hypothetical protein BLEM_2017 [Bifidobacterium lemurum]|uniref:Abi-like protein n=1 Tax=Bifidobacterium lemurum TaxID=1603886 RepID=A0A261FMK0_9BIFI|nr:hypothetical protein BLEM_2017 [Bifidobacterium lemurum]
MERGISPIRLNEYLQEVGGDLNRAVELYVWNSRMAAECFATIGHLEVLLRNAVDQVFKEYCKEDERGIPWFLQLCSGLNDEDLASIAGAREQNAKAKRPDSRDRIIATLTFGFWSHLFNAKHEELWRQCLYKVFAQGINPHVTRKTIAGLVESVRITRNRVAHQNFLKAFDIPKAMQDVFRLAYLISPQYGEWLERDASRWREVYDQCPQIDTDTLIVPGRVAWDIYQYQPIYVCKPERFFRDMRYLAFYENRSIRSQIPMILRVFDQVPWNEEEAQRLCASDDVMNRKLGHALEWAFSSEGREVAHGWANSENGYKVLLLTPCRGSKQGDDGHLVLPNGDIPHMRSGAYVQNHRYASSHDLLVARSTDDLRYSIN